MLDNLWPNKLWQKILSAIVFFEIEEEEVPYVTNLTGDALKLRQSHEEMAIENHLGAFFAIEHKDKVLPYVREKRIVFLGVLLEVGAKLKYRMAMPEAQLTLKIVEKGGEELLLINTTSKLRDINRVAMKYKIIKHWYEDRVKFRQLSEENKNKIIFNFY